MARAEKSKSAKNKLLRLCSVLAWLVILHFSCLLFAVPARVIWAAPEKDVELPCDLTPPSLHDSVKLVLWFKDTEGIPMYSLDSRTGGTLKAATHSALAGIQGERVFFSVAENPKDSKLRIRAVVEADGGIYRCRVDYFNSPTRNFRVNLTLVGRSKAFLSPSISFSQSIFSQLQSRPKSRVSLMRRAKKLPAWRALSARVTNSFFHVPLPEVILCSLFFSSFRILLLAQFKA
jgi:Immunoglobulin V-set domain